jgi:hypothetical protein
MHRKAYTRKFLQQRKFYTFPTAPSFAFPHTFILDAH